MLQLPEKNESTSRLLPLILGIFLGAIVPTYLHLSQKEDPIVQEVVAPLPQPQIKTEPKQKLKRVAQSDTLAELIGIVKEDDIKTKRKNLNLKLLGTQTLPSNIYPDKIEKKPIDALYLKAPALGHVERYTTTFDQGITVLAHHVIHQTHLDKLVLLYGGFNNDQTTLESLVHQLLKNGFSALVLEPALQGPNAQPILLSPNWGQIVLDHPEKLSIFENKNEILFKPLLLNLNYIKRNFDYEKIHIVGLFEGAIYTTALSALDPRIQKSVTISSNYPLYLRELTSPEWSHWVETSLIHKLETSYLTLTTLAALGENRHHLQVFNNEDPCCFGGRDSESYGKAIDEVIFSVGQGKFDILIDKTHKKHIFSEKAQTAVIEFLKDKKEEPKSAPIQDQAPPQDEEKINKQINDILEKAKKEEAQKKEDQKLIDQQNQAKKIIDDFIKKKEQKEELVKITEDKKKEEAKEEEEPKNETQAVTQPKPAQKTKKTVIKKEAPKAEEPKPEKKKKEKKKKRGKYNR